MDQATGTTRGNIEDKTAKIAVLGLGYVGLPLALHAAEAGFDVLGFDVSAERVEGLNGGLSPVTDITDEQVASHLSSGRFKATGDPSELATIDVFVICVPTPLKQELPDMSFIESAATVVAGQMKPGCLVILESTTYPGTTEEFLKAILEAGGLRAGSDFYLGFSPERIDPGNTKFGLKNVPKIIGGIDGPSAELMESFYGSFIDETVRVSSPAAAEMAKLLENTYRHINIALANEMAILCHDLGIDIWEVIDAAATKPFGFHPFYPGPGWGGHCIPVDPAYLSWRVRQMGETARFVELAREINERMPVYVVQRIGDCLNEQNKSLRSARVLILGVAYKPDISDLRESPALEILERLHKAGADVRFHDPFVDSVELKNATLKGVELDEGTLWGADLVVTITNHSSYDWPWIAEHAKAILDTRNALQGLAGAITKL
jgi:UDP-N-acetyl-D-glucosamine dehydrogenase